MPIRISTDESEPIPRTLALMLTCDSCDTGNTLIHAGDYPTAITHEKVNGWKERNSPEGKRLFLCPACSGKRKGTAG